jgi:hypothetical protein
VVQRLKAPWRDGTTHLVMSSSEFMQQRPAALVPRPRVHLWCSHDVSRERLLRGDQLRAMNVEGSGPADRLRSVNGRDADVRRANLECSFVAGNRNSTNPSAGPDRSPRWTSANGVSRPIFHDLPTLSSAVLTASKGRPKPLANSSCGDNRPSNLPHQLGDRADATMTSDWPSFHHVASCLAVWSTLWCCWRPMT